ncbi:MAG: RDD family protein, partial [Planctomycetales bacterium]|nr:RDD family protein [Planctomycetales bacterium]
VYSSPSLMGAVIIYGFTIFYYGLTESLWGASIGKALFRLRVVDQDGSNPRLGRSLARAFVFVVWPAFFTLVYHVFMFVMGFMAAMSLVEANLRPSLVIVMLLGPIYIVMFLLLFSAARRSNGYAGIHDRIGGVTVVSRHAETGRIPWSVEDLSLPQLEALPTIGPFSVLDTLAVEESSELLLAYDTKLLRRVWLWQRSRESAPVPEAIRNLSRPGRLRWLASGVEGDTVWDAYEAPRGVALVDALQEQPNWSSIRYWLSDLAEELRFASDEGTLPETVSLDRLWVTSDGRLKILDFAAPAVTVETAEVPSVSAATASSESYVRFIEDVSRFVTAPKKRSQRKQPLLVPLSAQRAIEHLAKATSLDVIADRLRALLLDAPAVTRPRRFGLQFCCAALSLFAGAGLLMQRIVVDVGQIDMAPKPELMELNYAASMLYAHQFSSSQPDVDRDAEMLRTWIVGHHRKT